jgi:hypothetical protein
MYMYQEKYGPFYWERSIRPPELLIGDMHMEKLLHVDANLKWTVNMVKDFLDLSI